MTTEQKHPNTVAELIEQAGQALADRDTERLEELDMIVNGWMISETERTAISSAINAMAEAAYLIKEAEED